MSAPRLLLLSVSYSLGIAHEFKDARSVCAVTRRPPLAARGQDRARAEVGPVHRDPPRGPHLRPHVVRPGRPVQPPPPVPSRPPLALHEGARFGRVWSVGRPGGTASTPPFAPRGSRLEGLTGGELGFESFAASAMVAAAWWRLPAAGRRECSAPPGGHRVFGAHRLALTTRSSSGRRARGLTARKGEPTPPGLSQGRPPSPRALPHCRRRSPSEPAVIVPGPAAAVCRAATPYPPPALTQRCFRGGRVWAGRQVRLGHLPPRRRLHLRAGAPCGVAIADPDPEARQAREPARPWL